MAGTERSLGCAELPVTLSPLPPGAVFFNVEAVTADGPRYQREVAQTLLTRGAQARLQLGVP
ncbi:MAG: hypothetical protein IPJ65_21590 [Archangiaceae bacterium]|nr:hypothetical protein [Archangiaceae bacterium]